MELPVELFRIIITETSPQQVIFLKEKGGDRSFPIVIGVHEALAIRGRLKGIPSTRPLTYDLLAQVIEAMGGRLEKIVINDLRDRTFIAKLVIQRDGEAIEVDSRPSDAIALGSAFGTPIFVAEHVFEQVVKDTLDVAGQRENLRLRRDELATGIAKLREHLDDGFALPDDASGEKKAILAQLREMQTELETIEEILRHLPE
jgi:hypothetical protein